jgi:hypothetical protein
MSNKVWKKNSIQFPRLLCEIVATQEVNISALADSMDLTNVEVVKLFERANAAWEKAKAKIATKEH